MLNPTDELKRQGDQEFLHEWAAIRRQGRTWFILRRGLLQWGGTTVLITLFSHWLFNRWHPLFAAIVLGCTAVLSPIAGGGIWSYNKQKFNRLQSGTD